LAPNDRTDWSRLHHAYGRAVETPGHLKALTADDASARRAALEHLWSAIVHQGTAYAATAPAALYVAVLLRDPEVTIDAALRASLVAFVGAVGSTFANSGLSRKELDRMAANAREPPADPTEDDEFYSDVDVADAMYARALLACLAIAPHAARRGPARARRHRRGRAGACGGRARVAVDDADDDSRAAVRHDLTARVRAATSAAERCAALLALAEVDGSLPELLDDPSLPVRVCAALSPALAADERATAVLLAAARDAAQLDASFEPRPPQMARWPRCTVIRALLERVHDFERLADAAAAVAAVTNVSCVDFDWGPLLAAAFPRGDGVVRTAGQRRSLRALVDQPDLWDRKAGSPRRWFAEAGLSTSARRVGRSWRGRLRASRGCA
jgi:hypothetical protein